MDINMDSVRKRGHDDLSSISEGNGKRFTHKKRCIQGKSQDGNNSTQLLSSESELSGEKLSLNCLQRNMIDRVQILESSRPKARPQRKMNPKLKPFLKNGGLSYMAIGTTRNSTKNLSALAKEALKLVITRWQLETFATREYRKNRKLQVTNKLIHK
jgi:hypothetical protein